MVSTNSSRSLLLLLLILSVSHLLPVDGRVLIRPSVSTLLPYNTELQYGNEAHKPFRRDSHPLVDTNYSAPHQENDNILPFIHSRHHHRRTGKQPAPATDIELASSAAKGCSMLYMLAASADDVLTRLKTNPKLIGLTSSQSKWDNAGALKQYGWTETKDPVNWGYMGVNKVMQDIGVDTASKDNVNVQLVQDTAVEVDGKTFVVSITSALRNEYFDLDVELISISGIQRNLRPSYQCRRRPHNPILHLLAQQRSEEKQHQRRSHSVRTILRRFVSGILQALRSSESQRFVAKAHPVPQRRKSRHLGDRAQGPEEQEQ